MRSSALAPASFASYALTLAEFVAPKPEHLSFEEAATIPICFLTVQLALRRLGQCSRASAVLIHAASGGVGLAAIQIARQVGAEIFATAGSPRKREYLKSLGIQHVMDSRSLDFADQIMEATGGEGIDLVVNSLTGETIAASLSVLRAGGRFLELGKTDLWDQARVDAVPAGRDVLPHCLGPHDGRRAAGGRPTAGRGAAAVRRQDSSRRLPLRAFPIAAGRRCPAAHGPRRAHRQGGDPGGRRRATRPNTAFALREDGTYLVTGGLGGLGLKVARWLVDRGARHLVLLGRSGASEEARRSSKTWKGPACRSSPAGATWAIGEQVAALLAEIRRGLPPLRGIFHLAGVLDDGVLREQTRERFDRVMAAKVLGAWNLHELTRDDPLDLFVLFSSAAALLGSPGQGNYAAANAFLDALAHHRRWEKLPALSVNWGSWAEVGMAARLERAEGGDCRPRGVGWIEPTRGLRVLEHLLSEDRIQAGVLPIDWPKFFERIPAGQRAGLADGDRPRGPRRGIRRSGPPQLLEELQAVTPAERLELAVTTCKSRLRGCWPWTTRICPIRGGR